MTEHVLKSEELFKKLSTDPIKGLDPNAADRLLHEIGPNTLTEKKGLPWYCLFLKELTGFFSLLLWFGAILCFIGYGLQPTDKSNLYLGIVLATVVLITGIFSFYQSSKSASLMAQFKNFIPPLAKVRRGGIKEEIEASRLVPGDIVLIQAGDNIPADLRILESQEMKVNNASLTGESEDLLRKPREYSEEAKGDEEVIINPLEATNMAFFGTACTSGSAEGIVVATGDRSVIGQIANLAQSANAGDTPLSKEIHRFIKIISAVAILLGVIFFVFGLFTFDIITNIVFAIGIIVANVPEGLLATVTVSLALTAKRMAVKKVLVKNLESVETLGSTSCICSDKTGTLTQNVMTVSHMWFNNEMKDTSINYQTWEKDTDPSKPALEYDYKEPTFRELMRCLMLGSHAAFAYQPGEEEIKRKIGAMIGKNPKSVNQKDLDAHSKRATDELIAEEKAKPYQQRKTVGDASESGLIKFAQALEDIIPYREHFPVHGYDHTDEHGKTEHVKCNIPFSSNIKFNMMIRDMKNNTEGRNEKEKHLFLVLKGAPERVIGRCSKVLMPDGSEDNFEGKWKNAALDANKELAALGERVLAFARIYLDPLEYPKTFEFNNDHENPNFPMTGLTFVGLISLNDPPRIGVDNSVQKCRDAGIKVIMVTGDQDTTAAAIASKVGIIRDNTEDKVCILNNENKMSEEETLAKLQSSVAVVVHGDYLTKKTKEDNEKDQDEKDRGKFLMRWILKDEVVFARTNPAQKLQIVDACQRVGHVVAVTGDGVNDSPAIKKADIGIAMGICGSDVAKNAADMLLLDDNFCSIVNGVEEGRLIFDNLKKSIAYTLSSNIPEIGPFISFIIFQFPLPLSTVLILCIDLGTDMVPAISFAYENAELDIMERKPRSSKRDHLVNTKLICFAYLQIGVIQCSAGFFNYFLVMNDFGYRPSNLFFFQGEKGLRPKDTDVFDPNDAKLGNTNEGEYGSDTVDWNTDKDAGIDLRMFHYQKPSTIWTTCRWDKSNAPDFYITSSISDKPICYSPDALKYA